MESEEMRRLYEEGHSLQDVSEMSGIPTTTLRRRFLSWGFPLRQPGQRSELGRQRASESHRANIPEARLRELSAQGLSSREIAVSLQNWSEEAVRKAQIRLGLDRLPGKARPEKNAFWNGGAVADKHGYILIHYPDHPGATKGGYVRQHRLIAEQILGRYLLPGEVVDHKNRDTSDNRDENLRVYPSNADHLRATVSGRQNLRPAVRAVLTRWAVQRAERRAEAIRQLSRSGADPSQWRYYRPEE